tara:strand:+ start:190 stop:321 length:132 start_codon:yes stop_codon:yes gene_type:complete
MKSMSKQTSFWSFWLRIGTAPYALPYRLLANRVIKKDGMVEQS